MENGISSDLKGSLNVVHDEPVFSYKVMVTFKKQEDSFRKFLRWQWLPVSWSFLGLDFLSCFSVYLGFDHLRPGWKSSKSLCAWLWRPLLSRDVSVILFRLPDDKFLSEMLLLMHGRLNFIFHFTEKQNAREWFAPFKIARWAFDVQCPFFDEL